MHFLFNKLFVYRWGLLLIHLFWFHFLLQLSLFCSCYSWQFLLWGLLFRLFTLSLFFFNVLRRWWFCKGFNFFVYFKLFLSGLFLFFLLFLGFYLFFTAFNLLWRLLLNFFLYNFFTLFALWNFRFRLTEFFLRLLVLLLVLLVLFEDWFLFRGFFKEILPKKSIFRKLGSRLFRITMWMNLYHMIHMILSYKLMFDTILLLISLLINFLSSPTHWNSPQRFDLDCQQLHELDDTSIQTMR